MADHNKPVTTDTYTSVLQSIRDIADEQAQLFDPATTSPTNMPTGTIRWNSAVDKFQKWSGSAWNTLTSAIKMAFAADAPCSITVSSTSAALTLTNTGTGNSFVVEDTSGDTTPFVVNGEGQVIRGYGTVLPTATYSGSASTPSIQQHGTAISTSAIGSTAWSDTSSTGPGIILSRSASTTIGTHSPVLASTLLGTMTFCGSDGTSFIPAASIKVEVDGAVSTGDMPGRLIFNTTPDGSGVPVEALRITSGQGVQIARTAVTAPIAADGNVFSGTYTPTLTNATNIDASTATSCQYMRVGNVVTVSGSVNIDPTAATGTLAELRISLPIASATTAIPYVTGTGVCVFGIVANSTYGSIQGGVANVAKYVFNANSTSNQTHTFHFTYQVI